MNKITLATNQIVITPPKIFWPLHLSGHAIRTEESTGVLEDIVCTQFLFKDKNKLLLWITLEVIGVSEEFSNEIIKRVHALFHIPKEHVIVSFTHTHAGPEIESKSVFGNKADSKIEEYSQWILNRIEDSLKELFSKEASSVYGEAKVTSIDGFYGNRNSKENIGDKEIIVINFPTENKQSIGTLLNINCHPTILGPQNLEISPDLAGSLRDYMETEFNSPCIVLLGAAGNMSNRLYREGNDLKELERVTRGISEQISSNNRWSILNLEPLSISTYEYNKEFILNIEDKKEKLEVVMQRIQEATSFDQKKVYTSAEAFLKYQIENFNPLMNFRLDCRFITLGELSIFTIPAELFSQFGRVIKNTMPTNISLVSGYTFYNAGYLYNKEEKDQSFESIVTNIPSGTTEDFIEEVIQYLQTQ